MQQTVHKTALGPNSLDWHTIIVDRTGRGKHTITTCLLGTLLKVMHLVIVPLMALTTDLITNFMIRKNRYWSDIGSQS